MMTKKNTAICTTVAEFFATYKDASSFADACTAYVRDDCGISCDDGGNRKPWEDCYVFLQNHLDVKRWGNFPILMEYMMPESQKRADVILLGQKQVLILECKMKNGEIAEKDITQAAGYQKSIQIYHRYTAEHNMKVSAYLTYTLEKPMGNLSVFPWVWRENFAPMLEEMLGDDIPMSMEEAMAWLHSPCDCLQHLIDAAVKLFENGELPQIKSIKDSDIQGTLDVIHQVIDQKSGKNIVFVTGVPGAGKTLVGLKILYDYLKQDAELDEGKKKPVFLSGNDPLVNILQHALDNRLIMPMKDYKKNAYNQVIPINQVIIFDEAQRAWDCGDYNVPGDTEAKKILAIGDKVAKEYGTVTILCLIGNGQAIHYNEETGMPIWQEALKGREDWQVFIPDVLEPEFPEVKHQSESCLYLDVSIRNDFINVSPWVEAVLSADLRQANNEYRKLISQGFRLGFLYHVTQLHRFPDILAREYQDWHTGLVVSSHLNNRSHEKAIFGPQYQGSYVEATQAYKWFTEDSKNLVKGASEFLIQGIEMDWPIVALGGDYYMKNGRWTMDAAAKFDRRIKNPQEIMKNTYRVLFTRSRKGMMLYIPAEEKMQETIQWFKNMRYLG